MVGLKQEVGYGSWACPKAVRAKHQKLQGPQELSRPKLRTFCHW